MPPVAPARAQPPVGSRTHRLVAEGRLLRRLTHPNLVRGYDVIAGPRRSS
jgi:hypothetical protein